MYLNDTPLDSYTVFPNSMPEASPDRVPSSIFSLTFDLFRNVKFALLHSPTKEGPGWKIVNDEVAIITVALSRIIKVIC